LACSSRNQYLNPEERKQATVLYKALVAAKAVAAGAEADRGSRPAADVVELARTVINEAPLARIDYVELVDAETLQPARIVAPHTVLLLAVFFGTTRLIDSMRLA
jgi:pantoate--beta-alanine ligase